MLSSGPQLSWVPGLPSHQLNPARVGRRSTKIEMTDRVIRQSQPHTDTQSALVDGIHLTPARPCSLQFTQNQQLPTLDTATESTQQRVTSSPLPNTQRLHVSRHVLAACRAQHRQLSSYCELSESGQRVVTGPSSSSSPAAAAAAAAACVRASSRLPRRCAARRHHRHLVLVSHQWRSQGGEAVVAVPLLGLDSDKNYCWFTS